MLRSKPATCAGFSFDFVLIPQIKENSIHSTYNTSHLIFYLQNVVDSEDIIFDDTPDINNKLVNKRSIRDVEVNAVEADNDDHWLWGRVKRLRRSIDSLMHHAPNHHKTLRKHRTDGAGSKVNRIRRNFGDDQDDNEIDVGPSNDDDEDLEDDDDDSISGSGFLYEETSYVYTSKPSRLCK